jgi:hypothetical protein
VGRNAESNPASRERRECVETSDEAGSLRRCLIGMWSEDLLIGDPVSAQLMKGMQGGAAVAGVGDGRDSLPPSIANSLLCRSEKIGG